MRAAATIASPRISRQSTRCDGPSRARTGDVVLVKATARLGAAIDEADRERESLRALVNASRDADVPRRAVWSDRGGYAQRPVPRECDDEPDAARSGAALRYRLPSCCRCADHADAADRTAANGHRTRTVVRRPPAGMRVPREPQPTRPHGGARARPCAGRPARPACQARGRCSGRQRSRGQTGPDASPATAACTDSSASAPDHSRTNDITTEREVATSDVPADRGGHRGALIVDPRRPARRRSDRATIEPQAQPGAATCRSHGASRHPTRPPAGRSRTRRNPPRRRRRTRARPPRRCKPVGAGEAAISAA